MQAAKLGRFGVFAIFGAVLAMLFAPVNKALAAATPWHQATHSQIRLLAVPAASPSANPMAGIQIRLDPGWKTYWINPGDSGVPPSFDWSGSENLKHADVLYPAPRTLKEAGGVAYGYENEVVFPVRIIPDHPDQPVHLKLKLDYGLCKNLCIPDQAKLQLTVAPGGKPGTAERLILDGFLDLVPKPVEEGKLPAVTNISADLDTAKPTLVIDTQFPPQSGRSDLYLLAPDAYIPPATASGPAVAGKKRFIVAFPNKQEAATLKGKEITLVLVADGGARETEWQVK